MGTLGEYVECQTCGVAFEPAALTMKAPPQPRLTQANLAALLNSLGSRLNAGVPVEYLVRDLTAAGLDRDVALEMITPHLAAGRKTCPTCNLTYAASVATCAGCHQPLPS